MAVGAPELLATEDGCEEQHLVKEESGSSLVLRGRGLHLGIKVVALLSAASAATAFCLRFRTRSGEGTHPVGHLRTTEFDEVSNHLQQSVSSGLSSYMNATQLGTKRGVTNLAVSPMSASNVPEWLPPTVQRFGQAAKESLALKGHPGVDPAAAMLDQFSGPSPAIPFYFCGSACGAFHVCCNWGKLCAPPGATCCGTAYAVDGSECCNYNTGLVCGRDSKCCGQKLCCAPGMYCSRANGPSQGHPWLTKDHQCGAGPNV
mmetsp:Transcript_44967/g.101158  ORF Transcript_44967/g.101158 Transcript_44967/m.101158 type:complete len:260 (-) Transcript_44967:60-839(-)|eukprot:CAMPEP_0197897110 /NCGR_PEP_ID=MMETSP1439-20131203/41677_1 /TAXON_ID=66791 /ORGANISM="Gonyaulax spinifera, Strain CCMP409" /LENGTH=259 /DNA_ID=CAMNT_0043517717 /DNA_START=39 /DNA_END=818 /DNA_ORIENTATION=-